MARIFDVYIKYWSYKPTIHIAITEVNVFLHAKACRYNNVYTKHAEIRLLDFRSNTEFRCFKYTFCEFFANEMHVVLYSNVHEAINACFNMHTLPRYCTHNKQEYYDICFRSISIISLSEIEFAHLGSYFGFTVAMCAFI